MVKKAWFIIDLDSTEEEDHFIPLTGGRFILAGRNCPAQIGLNDFGVQGGRSPGFFVLISGSENICLLVRVRRTPMFTM